MPRSFSSVLVLATACLPLLGGALSLPSVDHSLPGWNGEGPVVLTHDKWSGEILHLSSAPRAYVFKNFLSDEECDHLIKIAKPHMTQAKVADNKTGKSFSSELRTSTGTFLSMEHDPIVAAIEERVSQVTMIPIENQEAMQILHYENGQNYHQHYDYFSDAVNQGLRRGGQRLATMLMYLTTPEEGGETVFPKAERKVMGDEWSRCAKTGMAVKAVRGDASLFFSLDTAGQEDPTSLHGSCPTTKGQKWSATKWIHVGSTLRIRGEVQQRRALRKRASGCRDHDMHCSSWAAHGECDKNPEYMKVHCVKSCKLCKTGWWASSFRSK